MKPIANFRSKNPQCAVVIDASEDLARLEYGEAQIAVSARAKPDHPDYVVSSFGRVGFNLYAHDNYVNQYGLPTGLDDLHGHRFVVPPSMARGLPFAAWINEHVQADMIAVSSRDIWGNVEAITAGVGQGFMGDREAVNRGGHRVFAPNRVWSVTVWLVTHVDLHRAQKVQAMLDCLKSAKTSIHFSGTRHD